MGVSSNMGKFYGLKIKAREMTLEDVPKLWRNATETWLKENEEDE